MPIPKSKSANYKLFLILSFVSFQLHSQPSVVDSIVKEIYNQEFNNVQYKLETLKASSEINAKYLEVDYFWWQMVSNFNASKEAEFLKILDSLGVVNKTNESYSKLFYFIYQIRYQNLRQRNISKYRFLIMFHIYLDQIRDQNINWPNSFMKSIFDLINMSELVMKYAFLIDNGFKSQNNIEKYNKSLSYIENMRNLEYASFVIIKQYYLGKIYFDVEKNYLKALNKFNTLSEFCPDNLIFKKICEDCKRQIGVKSSTILQVWHKQP